MIFSDRFLAAKVVGTLLLFAFLLTWSGVRSKDYRPSFRDCTDDPGRYRGETIAVGASRVEEVVPGGVILREGANRIRILRELRDVTVGERLSFLGEFVPPDGIRPTRWTRHPGYEWKRVSMYAVSAGAILFLLGLFARRYRVDPRLPMFIPRD